LNSSRAIPFFSSLVLLTTLTSGPVRADTPLFESHAVLELSIPLDFSALCRPREDPDCDYAPTRLEYVDEHGDSQSLPIEVRIRGGWRSLSKNCSAPLLFIRFDSAHTAGTPFQDQTMLPLTTHCGRGISLEEARTKQTRSTWEQYLLKEYLAHRLYNVITPVSLNARLVQMTYPNPEKPDRKIRNFAFFTEHFESVARRNGYVLLERGSFAAEKLDLESAAQVAMFEFMIGNTDWSIVRERNIALLEKPDGSQVPLPFDFDMSGLVDAYYAGPAPSLPIDNVRERYYLGFCETGNSLETLFETYLIRKDALLATVDEIPELDSRSCRTTRRFLGEFFETLEASEYCSDLVVKQCQPLN
jgi:hypothetical protein